MRASPADYKSAVRLGDAHAGASSRLQVGGPSPAECN